MDFETYRQKNFVQPQPEARFAFMGILGATLFFSDFTAACDYYQRVLGPPAYMEGDDTRGWRLGSTWLTLLKAEPGSTRGVEVPIVMQTPEEAERLQAAFIAEGGQGEPPSDQLMYEPIRYCPATDPFGTSLLIYSPLPK